MGLNLILPALFWPCGPWLLSRLHSLWGHLRRLLCHRIHHCAWCLWSVAINAWPKWLRILFLSIQPLYRHVHSWSVRLYALRQQKRRAVLQPLHRYLRGSYFGIKPNGAMG